MRVLSKKCAHCGKSFTGNFTHGKEHWRKRKYCSLQCKYEAAPKTASVLTKSCEQCGRKFHNRRKSGRTIEPYKWLKARFCSPECKWKASRGQEAHNKGQRMDLREQFFRHVDKNGPNGCWLWTGVLNPKGYGGIQVNGKRAMAHRISYTLHKGKIPQGNGYHGTCVCHRCDNPQCVNPEHLFLGSHFVNMQDRDRKGRRMAPPGSRHGMSKIKEFDAIAIRRMHKTGRFSYGQIGRLFNISLSMVALIVNRKNWTHVP